MAKPTLTEKEVLCLANAWQCMETQPTINYRKLAELCGYTEGSARTIFANIRKKLKTMQEQDSQGATASSTATPSTPATGRKRKAAASGTASGKGKGKGKADVAEDEDVDETPTKKRGPGRPTKPKVPIKKELSVETHVEDDELGILSGVEDYADVSVMDNIKPEKLSDQE